jgi:hypothetical protein
MFLFSVFKILKKYARKTTITRLYPFSAGGNLFQNIDEVKLSKPISPSQAEKAKATC